MKRSKLTVGALLAIGFATGCDSGEPDVQDGRPETRFDLLPALEVHRATAGAARAGDSRERWLFGDDWYSPERNTPRAHAWVRGLRGTLELLVLEPERARVLELEVLPEVHLEAQAVEVRFNGESLGSQSLQPGWQRLSFELAADAVRVGANVVELVAKELCEAETAKGLSHGLALGWIGLSEIGGDSIPEFAVAAVSSSQSESRLDANQLFQIPIWAHDRSQVELRLKASRAGTSASARVRVHGRGDGPTLFDQILELDSNAQALVIDLQEASGDRLELEIGALSGSASLMIESAELVVPAVFSDVVFVVIDTLRADRLHDPEHRIETPKLDAFAASGAEFMRAYSHANLTLPSHTALFSSRLPSETGTPLNATQVRSDLPLIAEWMGELGYRTTATISMGTLMAVAPNQGVDRGFSSYDDDIIPSMDGFWANQRLEPDLASLASSEAPFFLFVHYSDPHAPFRAHGTVESKATISFRDELIETVAPPEIVLWERSFTVPPGESALEIEGDTEFSMRYLLCKGPGGEWPVRFEQGEPLEGTRELRAVIDNTSDAPVEIFFSMWLTDLASLDERTQRYDTEVEYVDGVIGAFFDELKALDSFDESLIIFTSDHGEGLGDHGQGGHGKALFNDQVHVPLVIKPPIGDSALERLRAKTDDLISHMDVVPTLLEMLKLPALPGQRGIPIFEDSERLSISESHFGGNIGDMYAIRDGRYTLMYSASRDLFVLYDVSVDPGELVDIFLTRGAEFEEWQQLLREIDSGALSAVGSSAELDPEAQHLLRGLGYNE